MAKVRGTKELRAALRRAPAHLREEAAEPVREHTKGMHRRVMELLNSASSYAPFWHGKMGMQDITGIARRTYRYSVIDKGLKGRVGLLSAKAARKAFYLKFFMFGTINQPARNVHDTAFEEHRDDYIIDQKAALERVLRKL